jgi:hypothetical protein
MATVDRTLFLLKRGNDLFIVQIYVDGIVFGGSSHNLVAKFADEMSREFEMYDGRVAVLSWAADQASE